MHHVADQEWLCRRKQMRRCLTQGSVLRVFVGLKLRTELIYCAYRLQDVDYTRYATNEEILFITS